MPDSENDRPRNSPRVSWQMLLVAAVLVASGVWFWASSQFNPEAAFLGPGGKDEEEQHREGKGELARHYRSSCFKSEVIAFAFCMM